MNVQQELFVEEYIKLRCRNATQAAINAGYSKKTAYSQGCRLLKKAEIAGLIEQRKSALRQEIQEEFIFDALTARKVMYSILNDADATDKDKIAVARDFLDRAEFKPTNKVECSGEINNPFAGLTTEELQRLSGVTYVDD